MSSRSHLDHPAAAGQHGNPSQAISAPTKVEPHGRQLLENVALVQEDIEEKSFITNQFVLSRGWYLSHLRNSIILGCSIAKFPEKCLHRHVVSFPNQDYFSHG